ncbi:hypothetical protein [Zoogloea sp.]|uniref:hypothetical protein n=1 Tax=Zoogloea sp. TaxID=49181 RepID=UPI0035B00884
MTDEKETVEKLLKRVENEIEVFEDSKEKHDVENPQGLKKEIIQYREKRVTLAEDYKNKYPALLGAWTQQNRRIKERWFIINSLPLYADSVSSIKDVITCQNATSNKIITQQVNIYGTTSPPSLLASLNEAKKDHEEAKLAYKTLTTLAPIIGTRLSEIDKWIQQIDELIPGENQSFAIYLFWRKVIHAHRDLGEGLDASCDFIANFQHRVLYIPESNPRKAPWLIPDSKYSASLNEAFLTAYRDTREAEIKARIAFDNAKAALDSLEKTKKEWTDKFDEKVKSALQGKHVCPVESDRTSCDATTAQQVP